jgi:hypothetical protein
MVRRVLVLLLLFAAAGAVAATAEVRVFQCRFRPAREAAAIAVPLLSTDGSLEIQPKQNTIVVNDRPDVLQRVAGALAAWDLAPAKYHVRLRLIMASNTPAPDGRGGPRIQGLGSELVGMFNFSTYEDIDSLELTASDGNTLETGLGKVYRVQMSLHSMPGDARRLQLAPFELIRREGMDKGVEVMRPMIRSSVSLKIGQTGILIAAGSEGAAKALIVILAADLEPAS